MHEPRGLNGNDNAGRAHGAVAQAVALVDDLDYRLRPDARVPVSHGADCLVPPGIERPA